MFNLKPLAFLCCCLLFWSGCSSEGAVPDASVIFKQAYIWNSVTESFYLGSLEVRDGKIYSLRSLAEKIESKENIPYILPGLFNAHVHSLSPSSCEPGFGYEAFTPIENLQAWASQGFTTVADMGSWGELTHEISSYLKSSPAMGPRLLIAGPIITVQGGYPDNWMPSSSRIVGAIRYLDKDEPSKILDDLQDMGANVVKIGLQEFSFGLKKLPSIEQEKLNLFVKEAQRRGFRVVVHALSETAYKMGLKAGVDAFIHGPLESLSKQVLDELAISQAYVVPTIWVWKSGWSVPDEEPSYAEKMKPLVTKKIGQEWDAFIQETHSSKFYPSYYVHEDKVPKKLAKDGYGHLIINLRHMKDRNVPFMFGTDAPYCFNTAYSSFKEVRELRIAGLTMAEIVRMMTVRPAQFFGVEDQLGSLEVGKIADLVVYKENPLEYLDSFEHPKAVYRRGTLLTLNQDPTFSSQLHFLWLYARALFKTFLF